MQTRCERQGQVEIGIIEHEGREFAALGATVVGRSVTGYTRLVHGEIQLSTWCGQTMLAARSEVVERYWSGSLSLMFRLPRGRFICGYALADNGMLFRGELVTGDEDDARSTARQLSDRFAEIDAEDDEAFIAEDEERLLDIEYRCPECGHEWTEQWSCACDSQCPNCGLKNIEALSWDEAD
jgi:predicted RNA-binding Zn-ribbon protein involved in translation (DUF1610 family)